MGNAKNTADEILSVAIDLMAEKGYKSVPIKEIAKAASVSEMTVFRTFGSKRAILDEAVNRYYYSDPMSDFFTNHISWDLEQDLTVICKMYQHNMQINKKVFLLAIMERNRFPDLMERINKHPQKLKEMLINYFQTMQQKEKVVRDNSETQALMVMSLGLGKFVSDIFAGDLITSLSMEDFLETSVKILAKGLAP